LIRFGAVQVQWRGSSNVGFSEPFGRSAASADALDRGSYPGFLFNLFCLKLFIFWRAALGPGPQIWGHQLFQWLDRQFCPIPPQHVRPSHEKSLLAATVPVTDLATP